MVEVKETMRDDLNDPAVWARYAPDLRMVVESLHDAKEAHTAWEAKFEGNVPPHDWAVWYAQRIFVHAAEKVGIEVTPIPIAKLMTLLGPEGDGEAK